jgi:hypothetical protein
MKITPFTPVAQGTLLIEHLSYPKAGMSKIQNAQVHVIANGINLPADITRVENRKSQSRPTC